MRIKSGRRQEKGASHRTFLCFFVVNNYETSIFIVNQIPYCIGFKQFEFGMGPELKNQHLQTPS